ncbi:MAG: DUF4846 domain-containing protein [Muribaculaceae bacterium]|nr:DUF4846 domain-containing protein [Muribaculaceae bacterium]
MKISLLVFLLSIPAFFLSGCSSSSKQKDSHSTKQDSTIISERSKSLILEGNTIRTRFEVPEDFKRTTVSPGSFEEFLQNLPLKPLDSPVRLYNAAVSKDSLYRAISVVDMSIDSLNLQHSHESIIRLRAEYLYKTKQYDKISFIIKNNISLGFNRWLQGYRIESKGKDLKLKKRENERDMNYQNFRSYLNDVFKFTDAKSFKQNLRLIKDDDDDNEFGIGTIIMSGRTPYDAVIVVDMIEMTGSHPYSYMKAPGVLLAYGNSPAQEMAITRSIMDWLGIFPTNRGDKWKENAGSIWTTTTKGERQIDKQGGNIDIWKNYFINKKLYKFI